MGFRIVVTVAGLMWSLLHSGCGGGDTTLGPPGVPASPGTSAAWPMDFPDFGWLGAFGATTSGAPTQHLIFATSAEWGLIGVYGEDAATDFKVRGQLSASGFSASGPSRFDIHDPERTTVRGDMTLDPVGPMVSGTFIQGNQHWSIAGGAFSAPGYRFDQQVSLAAIAGRWELTTSEGRGISMQIDVNGDISGTSGSCAIYGSKVTPTRTGSGLYAITLRFTSGSTGCSEPHGGSDGVYGFALAYSSTSGSTQLVIAAANGWDPVFLTAAGKR